MSRMKNSSTFTICHMVVSTLCDAIQTIEAQIHTYINKVQRRMRYFYYQCHLRPHNQDRTFVI